MSTDGKGTSFSIEHLGSSQTSPSTRTRRVKEGGSRAAKISVESKRKEVDKLGPISVIDQMQSVFESYCHKDRYIQRNVYEMDLLKVGT